MARLPPRGAAAGGGHLAPALRRGDAGPASTASGRRGQQRCWVIEDDTTGVSLRRIPGRAGSRSIATPRESLHRQLFQDPVSLLRLGYMVLHRAAPGLVAAGGSATAAARPSSRVPQPLHAGRRLRAPPARRGQDRSAAPQRCWLDWALLRSPMEVADPHAGMHLCGLAAGFDEARPERVGPLAAERGWACTDRAVFHRQAAAAGLLLGYASLPPAGLSRRRCACSGSA